MSKVFVVTGASGGIGFEIARVLVRADGRVVVVARNPLVGARALDQLRREGVAASVELMLADLSLQGAVRRFVQEFRTQFERLDVLVNNAGVALRERSVTAEGVETTFAVNYLAPFLLSNLLADLLAEGGGGRIVNVASEAHGNVELDLDDLNSERGYDYMGAYSRPKLALVYFTYELAARLEGQGVTVNACCPGAARTNLADRKRLPPIPRMIYPVAALLKRSPARAAREPIRLALSPAQAAVTGGFFVDGVQRRSSPVSYDRGIREALVGLRP